MDDGRNRIEKRMEAEQMFEEQKEAKSAKDRDRARKTEREFKGEQRG